MKRWWHAGRGRVTLAEIDLRVGGTWRYVATTDDGMELAFHGSRDAIIESGMEAGLQDALDLLEDVARSL